MSVTGKSACQCDLDELPRPVSEHCLRRLHSPVQDVLVWRVSGGSSEHPDEVIPAVRAFRGERLQIEVRVQGRVDSLEHATQTGTWQPTRAGAWLLVPPCRNRE